MEKTKLDLTQSEWDAFDNDQKIDYKVKHELWNSVSVTEYKSWCIRHAFDDKIKDYIFNRVLCYNHSITIRWTLSMFAMYHAHKIQNIPWISADYVNEHRNELFDVSYNITNLPRIEKKPYEFIESNGHGLWRLTSRGIDFLNKKIKVPESVLFSTVGNTYKATKDEIYVYEVKKLTYNETLQVLKTN